MRKDAILFELPPTTKPKRGRKRVRGALLAKPFKLADMVKFKKAATLERGQKRKRLLWTKHVIWYHVSKRPVAMVISRDPYGKEKDDFFVTTDLSLTPQTVVSRYAGRWCIEETFKNIKQLLGGQQPQSFVREGPSRAAAMSFWLYSTVWLWYLENKRYWKVLPQLPWYRSKTNPSFADALACLRRHLWKERINCMSGSQTAFETIPKSVITALAYAA
jgi:hypothetical protein